MIMTIENLQKLRWYKTISTVQKQKKMNDYDDRKESVMHRSAIINKAIVE